MNLQCPRTHHLPYMHACKVFQTKTLQSRRRWCIIYSTICLNRMTIMQWHTILCAEADTLWNTLSSVNSTICWMIRRLRASLEMSLIMGSLNRFSKFCFWHSTGFLTFSLSKADLFSYPLMTRSVFLSCVPFWLDPSSSWALQLPHWPHWHFSSISLSCNRTGMGRIVAKLFLRKANGVYVLF